VTHLSQTIGKLRVSGLYNSDLGHRVEIIITSTGHFTVVIGLPNALVHEIELETWLGSDIAIALITTWDKKGLDRLQVIERSSEILQNVTGKDFEFI